MLLAAMLVLLTVTAIGWYIVYVERNVWLRQFKRLALPNYAHMYRKWDHLLSYLTVLVMVVFVLTCVVALFHYTE